MLKNKKTHLTSMVPGLLIADSAISLTVLNYRPIDFRPSINTTQQNINHKLTKTLSLVNSVK